MRGKVHNNIKKERDKERDKEREKERKKESKHYMYTYHLASLAHALSIHVF